MSSTFKDNNIIRSNTLWWQGIEDVELHRNECYEGEEIKEHVLVEEHPNSY